MIWLACPCWESTADAHVHLCCFVDEPPCKSRPAANDVLDAWMELVGVPAICPSGTREPECNLHFVEMRPEYQQVRRVSEDLPLLAMTCLVSATTCE